MQRNDVREAQQFVERNRFTARRADRVRRDGRIEDEPPAFEWRQSLQDFPADASEADTADSLIPERFHSVERSSQPPFAVADQQRVRHHLTRGGEEEGQRLIGDLVDAIIRHVADGDVLRPGRFEIDVIHADAVPHDDLGLPHGGDHVGLHRSELRDDGIRLADERDQRFRRFALTGADFGAGRLEDFLFDFQRRKRVVCNGNRKHGRAFPADSK